MPTETGRYDLAVYSLSGQRLRAVQKVRDRHTLSLGELPAATYFLIVSANGRLLARRRVIVR